jgi:PAS domain S-box-containing protein
MKTGMQFKRYLIRTFLLVAIIPLLISAMMTLPNLFNRQLKDISDQNITIAQAVVTQTQLFLQQPLILMSVVIEDLNSHNIYAAQFVETVLGYAIRSTNLFESIYLLDKNKKIIAIGLPANRRDFRQDFIGLQMGHKPFIKKTISTQQATWSNTFLSATSGKTSAALAIPLKNGYILVGDIDLSELSLFLSKLQSAKHKTSIILDPLGQIIAHPVQKHSARQINLSHLEIFQKSLISTTQSMKFEWDGKNYFGTAIPIKNPEWIVMVYEDELSATKQLRTTANYFIVSIILALFGSFWLAIYLSRKIATPVESMAQYANQIALGNYQQKLPESVFFEIEQLSHSMSSMAQAVATREQQLENKEKRYRSIFNATSDALFIQDASNAKIIDVNSRMLELYQLDHDSALSKTIEELSSPLQDYSDDYIFQQFENAKQNKPVVFEWLAKDNNNETFPVEVSLSYLELDKHSRIIASVRDITKRKQAEKEIEKTKQKYFHHEKIASLGQMVAGVLHEIGNPISAISGTMEQLEELNRPEQTKADCHALRNQNRYFLEIVKSHTDRLEGITKEVANFVSPQVSESEFFNLNSIIERSHGLLRYERKLKYINTDYALNKNISAVCGIQEHVVQVFLNLMLNASAACQAVSGRESVIMVRTEMDKGFVVLSVTDNGIGMSDDIQQKALTPFFTTKQVGVGTGLGLSLCKSLIEEQQGELEIISIQGIGTEVRVYLAALSEVF